MGDAMRFGPRGLAQETVPVPVDGSLKAVIEAGFGTEAKLALSAFYV
jgi:hypothetical protein